MKRSTVLLYIFCLTCLALAQTAGQRYLDPLFTPVISATVQYHEAVSVQGELQKLAADIYLPSGDSMKNRPLVIYMHGGGFRDYARASRIQSRMCNGLAARGYAVANIDYRVSPAQYLKSDKQYFEALYRAVQDCRAALRYFKQNAKKYNIDTSKVYLMGNSAGAKIALHTAYLLQNHVPDFIDTGILGLLDCDERTSNISPAIDGVIGLWGAIWDYRLINDGKIPVYCVHGTGDTVVPYDSSFSYHGFKYGSKIIIDQAVKAGIKSGIRLFYKTGHTLDNDAAKQDSALISAVKWLFNLVKENSTGCLQFNTLDSCGGNYSSGIYHEKTICGRTLIVKEEEE